jgi:hypothetical protein
VPEGVAVAPLPGGNGVFNVTALTLRESASGPELYVAARNDGDEPACSPSFSVELLDESEQSLGTGITGLLVRRFFRTTDGSGTLAACAAPGDVTLAAITGLPSDLPIERVRRVVYHCNYWVLDVTAIGGISISDVRSVPRSGGVAYTGTLFNGFDVPLSAPAVSVFPLNRVGRPLGVARGNGGRELAPGGSWDFETDVVTEAGVDQAAYPAHGP